MEDQIAQLEAEIAEQASEIRDLKRQIDAINLYVKNLKDIIDSVSRKRQIKSPYKPTPMYDEWEEYQQKQTQTYRYGIKNDQKGE